MDFILWTVRNIGLAFYDFGIAVSHPGLWLNWSDPQAIMRFAYYGGSVEFFFVVFTAFLLLTVIGLIRREVMWGTVRLLEGFANAVGRVAAWAGLLMVLQQIMIVFVQRIFAQAQLGVGFGTTITYDVSWWGEELKLYNAIIVALCCTYTFVQGSHVRVDLIYSAVNFRRKRIIDAIGSLIFMMPAAVMFWLYSWFFMWRHLITPKISASDTVDALLRKATILKWNVETVGFSPNGFNGYFLFKILMVAFAGMVFVHAIAFFYRSLLECIEGEESAGKYLDKDTLGEGEEAYEGTH
jgi:TRAP-type mannitol/chloroaromatic compound transport system permease small subunit